MQIYTTYKVKIKYYNHIFNASLNLRNYEERKSQKRVS